MFEMLYEKYFYKKNRWLIRGAYSVLTFVVSVIFYVEYSRTNDYYNIYYFTLIPISIVLFLLIPILKKKENFEKEKNKKKEAKNMDLFEIKKQNEINEVNIEEIRRHL